MRLTGLGAVAASLTLTAALFAPGTAAQGDATLEIGSLDRPVGSQETVELWALDVPPPGLGAWTVDVVYDPDLLNVTSCSADHGGICNTEYDENKVRVAGVSVFGLSGDRRLASITFSCKVAGESALVLDPSAFSDATPGDPQPIEAKINNGVAVCTEQSGEPPPDEKKTGDVNCDGEVDPIDAALILQLVAGLLDELPCGEHADVNGDGQVDSVDAALILQKAANLI